MSDNDELRKQVAKTLLKHSPLPGSYTPSQIFAWVNEDYGADIGWLSKQRLGRVLKELSCHKHHGSMGKCYYVNPSSLSIIEAIEEEEHNEQEEEEDDNGG